MAGETKQLKKLLKLLKKLLRMLKKLLRMQKKLLRQPPIKIKLNRGKQHCVVFFY